MATLWWLSLATILVAVKAQRQYDLDEYANCGRTINVDDSGIRINGRGNQAPTNPPLNCIMYMRSAYSRDDGSNKLQIEVEALQIRDCNVRVDLYNGRVSVGGTLQALSCQYGSTGIIYSTGPEVTIKFTRPDRLVHNEYHFTLLIKPYKDQNVPGTRDGVEALSVGGIIGIIIGCLVLIALVILFLWCCCTGRLGNFNVPGRPLSKASYKGSGNMGSNAAMTDSAKPGIINFQDPVVWSTVTTGQYQPGQGSRRYYQRGIPRNATQNGPQSDYEKDGVYRNWDPAVNKKAPEEYEQYDFERRKQEKEADKHRQLMREIQERQKQPRKETLIDDVFDTDSETKCSEQTNETYDDATLQKRPPGGSPKADKKDLEIPEETDSEQMQRYMSIDLQSQPDQDTMSSPLHINAGVRASVDDDTGSLSGSLKKKKKSPSTKRKGTGKEPDPVPLPPEAFDPIFTAPITGIDYKQPQGQYDAYQGYPGFMPYGLIPAGAFTSAPPGSQTVAYAYQTVPQGYGGQPVVQGAWIMQKTPTTDGNRRTAYAVEETVSPHKNSPRSHRRKNSDPFRVTPYKDSSRPKRDWNRINDSAPDLSIIARGAAPTDPGQGNRTVAMKSGHDPDTGMQTTQVMWTDTAPDKTDPKPGANPQITRKTVTRVTTKSGYGELVPEPNPMAMLGDTEPAFLSPSSASSRPAIMPAAYTPDRDNVAFYTGSESQHSVPPPERTSTPASMHLAPSYNIAIRDRIPLDDSTV